MASRSSHWQLFGELLRPHRSSFAVLSLVLLAASLLPLAGPQLLRAFIDRAVAGSPLPGLLVVAAAYVALGVVAQAATVATTYAATRTAWAATNVLRERAATHALHLDIAFHGGTSPGTLIERIDGDATAITRLFTDVVLKVTGGALTLVGAVLLVSLTDWRVGIALAVFCAGAMALVVRLRNRAVPATTAERAAYADVIGVVEEQIDGVEDVRALGAGPFALDRHELASGHHSRALLGAWRASAGIWTSVVGTFAIGSIGMLAAGWLLHRRGAITIGSVFLLFQYMQVLRRPMETIAEHLQDVQRAGAGATRILRLLEERTAVVADGTRALPDGPLEVTFADVSFAYADDGRTVLDAVDLRVPAGTVVGLVGATGSGKTTMARLALRLVDPTCGAVRLGGVDLRDVDPSSLRDRVAIVTQDVQLFDASLRDNLTLFADQTDPASTRRSAAARIENQTDPASTRRSAAARIENQTPPVSDEALVALLGELGLGSWLATLPDGLDTPLRAGAGLSAGQAQLLGLGRAFLRDPGLVVLDEASSRVDPATVEGVEAALDRLLAGRTVIVIAHRLRVVDRADAIVVLDHGRIVEQGDPTVLAADPTSRFATLLSLEAEGVVA